MIPLRDNIPSRTTPLVNYAMIAICAVVFFMQVAQPNDPMQPKLVERYGMIPARISKPNEPVEIVVDQQIAHSPDGRIYVDQEGRPVVEVTKREAAPSAVPPLL